MIQICFSVFCVISTVTCGYGNVNKSVSLYSVRAITEKSVLVFIFAEDEGGTGGKEINMGNITGNCTDTKTGITVKTVFDGNQSGQQAFMKLIRRKYRTSETDAPNSYIDKTTYIIDKTQYMDYTKNSGADIGGTTVGFAENGGQHDGF